MSVNDKNHYSVNWGHIVNVLGNLLGCAPRQKDVAERLGLTEGNFSMKKRRGTLLAVVVAWCLENKVSIDYVLGLDFSNKLDDYQQLPAWLNPYLGTLDSLNEFDRGRLVGWLESWESTNNPDKIKNQPGEENQIAVAGAPRNRNGTR